MKLDMELFERFLLEISSPTSKKHINDCFSTMRDAPHPGEAFVQGSAIINGIAKQETPEGFAAVNGMLFGIVLCYSSKFSEVEDYMKGFIEYRQRTRGENVFDIFQAKAGRKK